MLKQIKNGLIHGISFVLIVGIAGISYSAWQTNIERAVSNTPLTAVKYNQLVDRLEEIDSKQFATAWVNFKGINCTLVDGTQCLINDGYNIDKVVRISDGKWEVYFSSDMVDDKYSCSSDSSMDGGGTNCKILYNNKVVIYNQDLINGGNKDVGSIYLQIFGGKN